MADEVQSLLPVADFPLFARTYHLTPEGNWEGHNILNLPKTLAQSAAILKMDETDLREILAASLRKLFEVRERRG